MRFTTYGLLLSVVTVISVYAYTVLNTKHLLDVIRHQPGCFPPYILMNEPVGFCRKAATTSRKGRDDGLKPHASQQRREPGSHALGDTDG